MYRSSILYSWTVNEIVQKAADHIKIVKTKHIFYSSLPQLHFQVEMTFLSEKLQKMMAYMLKSGKLRKLLNGLRLGPADIRTLEQQSCIRPNQNPKWTVLRANKG